MNYLSGARTWVLMSGGKTAQFDTYQVSLMKKGVIRSSQHTTRQAPPLTPSQLKATITYLRAAGPSAQVLTTALLIGYYTLLRQGNLLYSEARDDPGHTLLARDVHITENGLIVTVWSTKTRWKPSQSYKVLVPAIPGSPYCPVTAWSTYTALQRPPADGPAFLLRGGGPLLAPTLLAALRLALTVAGTCHAHSYMLHSLRRGGAQACAHSGDSLHDIMELGSWTSSAVHTYVPKELIKTGPQTLAKLFG